MREICQALDIPSTSTVTYHLDALQANGLIHRDPGVTRSLRLFKPDGAQTKPIGPRTERIVRRILGLGERGALYHPVAAQTEPSKVGTNWACAPQIRTFKNGRFDIWLRDEALTLKVKGILENNDPTT